MSNDLYVELKVKTVLAQDTKYGLPVIVLCDTEGNNVLCIPVEESQAGAIHRILNNLDTDRPMTHDLLIDIIDVTALEVMGIVITSFDDGIFYSHLQLQYPTSLDSVKLDCRPSDGIVVALSKKQPIFIKKSILADQGTTIEAETDDDENRFRQFIRSVKASDFKLR